jgi:hypothetical protein
MGLGFDLAERITGTYYRLDDPLVERALRIVLRLSVDGVTRFLRERRIEAEGMIFADGLTTRRAGGAPIRGVLEWKLLDQKRVTYDLAFDGDDGTRYRLRGQRDLFLYDFMGSLGVLPATLFDSSTTDDVEVARATLRFDPRFELPALLKSFRPRLTRPLFSRG